MNEFISIELALALLSFACPIYKNTAFSFDCSHQMQSVSKENQNAKQVQFYNSGSISANRLLYAADCARLK